GGDSSVESKFIPPTVVSGVKVSDPLMEDEIFGPMVGVMEVKDEDEAIRLIQSRDRPLSLYVNTNNPEIANKVLDNTISGSALVNGYMMNMFIGDMPFGGVGASGMGSYHGHAGFLAFTHQRGLVYRGMDAVTEAAQKLLYAPGASSGVVLAVVKAVALKGLPTRFSEFVKKYGNGGIKLLAFLVVFKAGKEFGGVVEGRLKEHVMGVVSKVLEFLK
ncbi:hypothetical protein HDU98_004464, partial [Podochytrium sp. JEL0797]